MNPGVPLLHFQHIFLISWAFLIHKHGTWVWREICEKSVHVRGCNEDVTHNEGTEDPFNLQDFMKPPESFTSNIVSQTFSGQRSQLSTCFVSIGGGFNLAHKKQNAKVKATGFILPKSRGEQYNNKMKKTSPAKWGPTYQLYVEFFQPLRSRGPITPGKI